MYVVKKRERVRKRESEREREKKETKRKKNIYLEDKRLLKKNKYNTI
jgi:hypothetical protein